MSVSLETDPIFREASIVTIYVGKSRVAFPAHRDHLCHVSPVLKSAFLGSFKESVEQTFNLPDHDPDCCERFLQWVYTKRCGLSQDEKIPKEEGFLHFAQLYILASYLQVEKLQNHVIDEIFAHEKLRFTHQDVEYVYEHTAENSPLRKMMLSYHTYPFDLNWYNSEGAATLLRKIPEFASDLAIAFAHRLKTLEAEETKPHWEKILGARNKYYVKSAEDIKRIEERK